MPIKKYNLSVDVGGTNIRAAIVKNSKIISPILEAKTPGNFSEFKQVLNFAINKFAGYSIDHVGIGLPGAVDSSREEVIFCPNLSYLNNKKATDLISIKKPVKVGNDVDLALIAEVNYNRLEKQNVLLLNIGTGLGAAYYLNGRYSCQIPFTAEAGHIKIIKDGRTCHCGTKGCLEAYFSGWGLLEQAREIDPSIFNVEEIFESTDPKIKQLIKDNVDLLAIGIANMVNLLGANIVILGGQLSNSLPQFINQLKSKTNQNVYGGREIVLNKSSLINKSTLIGASLFWDM